MEKDNYKIKYDNLEHIHFHDCTIKQLELSNGNLFLYFNWLFILKSHPNNDTGNHTQTDNALVCFQNVKLIKSQWHDYTKAIANAFEKKKQSGDTSVVLNINSDEIEVKDIDFPDALTELFLVSLNAKKTAKHISVKLSEI